MCEQEMNPPVQYAPDSSQASSVYATSYNYAPIVHQNYYHANPPTSVEYYPSDVQHQQQHQQTASASEYHQFVQHHQQQQQQQQLQSTASSTQSSSYQPSSSYLVHSHHQLPVAQTDTSGYQTDYYQANSYHHLTSRQASAQVEYSARYYPSVGNNNHYDSAAYNQQQQQQHPPQLLAMGSAAYETSRSSATFSSATAQRPPIATAITNEQREFQTCAISTAAAAAATHAVDSTARDETTRQSGTTCQQQSRPPDQDHSGLAVSSNESTRTDKLRRPPAQVGAPGDPVRSVAPNRADAPLAAVDRPTVGVAPATRTLLAPPATQQQQQQQEGTVRSVQTETKKAANTTKSTENNRNGLKSGAIATHQTIKKGGLVITRRKNATRETTAMLKDWLDQHGHNPYPTKGEKIMLSIITKMSLTQVSTWFANARRRMKKEDKSHPWINNHHNYANNQATSQLTGEARLSRVVVAAAAAVTPSQAEATSGRESSQTSSSSSASSSSSSSSSSATTGASFPIVCAYECCSGQANNGPISSSSGIGSSSSRPTTQRGSSSPQTSRVESPSTTSREGQNNQTSRP